MLRNEGLDAKTLLEAAFHRHEPSVLSPK